MLLLVVALYENGHAQTAVKETDLLLAVAKHKQTFFPSAWAKYDEAKPGMLRLVPPEHRRRELERDYERIQAMIFGTPPEFEHLLQQLQRIESDINGR